MLNLETLNKTNSDADTGEDHDSIDEDNDTKIAEH